MPASNSANGKGGGAAGKGGGAAGKGGGAAGKRGGAAKKTALHHTLVVLVENKAGVLTRVAGLFSRRGFNIVSLAVAPTDDERFSRITIVVDAESAPLEQIIEQLDKLVNVVEIQQLSPEGSVERELLVATVKASPEIRGQVMDLVRIFEARVLNVGADAMMVSLSGTPRRISDFAGLLRSYGIVEVQRSGKVALSALEQQDD